MANQEAIHVEPGNWEAALEIAKRLMAEGRFTREDAEILLNKNFDAPPEFLEGFYEADAQSQPRAAVRSGPTRSTTDPRA